MAFKKTSTPTPVPESPDRLFLDLPRRKHASLFDHQGQILRTYAAKALDAPDVALQLPTGSGKTLVGLLLAEWRRRKFGEKVLFLCPTRQLVNQVAEEAGSKYGISVTTFTGSARDYSPSDKAAYQGADRVAITTYSSLFNTNPFFRDPEIIILDDAHTAENYVASHWTIRVSRHLEDDQTLFWAIAGVLKDVLSDWSYARLTGDIQNIDDLSWSDKIPTRKVLEVSEELRIAISATVAEKKQAFAWSVLADHISACQVYISSSEVLIRPLIPPTWRHQPFAGAKQRVFMSATLGSGGDLERLTGRPKITRLPVPEGWDRQGIGRRFFIFPEKSLNEAEFLQLRRELMKDAGRSLILTTSDQNVEIIKEDLISTLKFPIYQAADLETSRTAFVNTNPAISIVANRYDGIDFPDDDCRLLFVEGLPTAVNLQERFLMSRMGANLLFNERIQTRVLQAIGRCTRGLNDYSAVVVTGEDLPAYLTDKKRRTYLHPELQAELSFGIEQSTEVCASEILENFRIFLEHGSEWEAANDTILSARASATQAPFPAMDDLASVVSKEIAWQQAMWNEDYAQAFEAAREVLGGLNDSGLRGYRALWHYLAGSAAGLAVHSGQPEFEPLARQQFTQAKAAAAGIPWLVELARGSRYETTASSDANSSLMLQIERLESYLQSLGTLHDRAFAARERMIREGLALGESFEAAQVLLGEHLGFAAGKKEIDASPDPWWMIGNQAFVFEDHANAGEDAVIDATKARQAGSHPDWMKEHVPGAKDATILPILVTPAKKAKEGAIPHLGRVYYWDLTEFRCWADRALVTIRELRRNFVEPGNLVWRSLAAEQLSRVKADAPGLAAWLSERTARDHLSAVS